MPIGTRKTKILGALVGVAVVAALGWLWEKSRIFDSQDYERIDRALRELRSLDRTINQDVLRARYQPIDSYDPVLRSYRRIEQLEALIEFPPGHLDATASARLSEAVNEYKAAATAKQVLIESFKYRNADLKELFAYLSGAGAGVTKAAIEGHREQIATDVNRVVQETLLYNFTSDERYEPLIRGEIDVLAAECERSELGQLAGLRRRMRTLVYNIRILLRVKPEVDVLLRRIFDAPIAMHQESVTSACQTGYAAAGRKASLYRLGLYAVVAALVGLAAARVRRLHQTALTLWMFRKTLGRRMAGRTRNLALGDLRCAVKSVVDQSRPVASSTERGR